MSHNETWTDTDTKTPTPITPTTTPTMTTESLASVVVVSETEDNNNDKNTTDEEEEDDDDDDGEEEDDDDDVVGMIDITSIVRQCATMTLTKSNPFFCNERSFNLHDAMGATQLTDPKMDCCVLPIHTYHHTKVKTMMMTPPEEKPISTDVGTAPAAATASDERTVFPRPLPYGLDDKMTPLVWDELTIYDSAAVVLQILVRFQSLLSGASTGESTFTCLYAHCGVLSDMKVHLDSIIREFDTNCFDNNLTDTITTTTANNNAEFNHGTKSTTSTVACDNTPIADGINNNNINILDSLTLSDTTIAQLAIFASTLALVDTTEVVRGVILNADIYEEEDFTSNTHQIPFYTDQVEINTTRIVQSTIKVLVNYQDRQRQQQNQKSTTRSDTDAALLILQHTLEYQLDFLVSCTLLARLAQLDLRANVVKVQFTIQNAVQTLEKMHTILETHNTHTSSSSDETTSTNFAWMNENADMTMSVLHKGFDSYANRPFVGNLPVRKVSFQRPITAVQTLHTITTELDEILCNLLLNGTSIRRIHRILDRCNRYACRSTLGTTSSPSAKSPRSTVPTSITVNILTRSLLLLNLYFEEKLLGQYSLQQLILDDIVRSKYPSHLPQINQQQISVSQSPPLEAMYTSTEHARAFLSRLAKPTYDVLKLRLLNRNRHRAYIEAICLQDWLVLQDEAQVVDRHIRRYYEEVQQVVMPNYYRFTQYTLSVTISLMDRYVESGIEVGLFSNTNNHHAFDLSFAYWYRSFLLSALSHNITRSAQLYETDVPQSTSAAAAAPSITIPVTTPQPRSNGGKGKGSKKKTGNKNNKATTSAPTSAALPALALVQESDIEAEEMLDFKFIIIKRTLCRKIVEFIAALQQAGILQSAEQQTVSSVTDKDKSRFSFQFTSPRRIFDKRFELFQAIRQPPALSYDNYMDGVDFSNVTPDELLESASRGFQAARSDLDQLLHEVTSATNSFAATAQPIKATVPTSAVTAFSTSTTMIDPFYVSVTVEEIKSLMKICIGNSVYIQKLRQIVEARRQHTGSVDSETSRDDKVNVAFDFDSHVQFCIIKLTSA